MFIKFDKDKLKITISNQIILILIGVIIVLCILFANGLSSTIVGFWGSILGGIIGGIFTVVGVSQSIRHESDKTRGSELSQTIIQLLEMKKQLNSYNKDLYEFSNFYVMRRDPDTLSYEKVLHELREALDKFRFKTVEFEYKMTHASIYVDIDTYRKVSQINDDTKDTIDESLTSLFYLRGQLNKANFMDLMDNLIAKTSGELNDLNEFLQQKNDTYMQEYEELRKK